MNILIRSARIIDPASDHNSTVADILIENGVIRSIRPKISPEKNARVIEGGNLHVSAGWVDMQANFCDPGFEYKEDLQSGTKAAAAGGFTGVAVVPSTNPPVHSKAEVQYIRNNTRDLIVDIYPIGALSHRLEGKDISEMYDMHSAGAIAFSDDKKPVENAGLLMRALLYAKNFDGLIITHCDEKSVSSGGQMNEGVVSTRLGLKGIPSLAEELMINRNIFLAEYTGAAIHLANISTARSAELVRQAKAKGLPVTASATAYSLAMEESLLEGFDSNYKVNPPLRTKADVEALRKALSDGTIDAISTDHRPQDIESKDIEFDHASNGMIGLETAFPLLNSNKGRLRLETLIRALTTGPRTVLGLPSAEIREGAAANLTLFDPDEEWTYSGKKIQSRSANSPFIGKTFTGKVIGIVNKKQLHLNK